MKLDRRRKVARRLIEAANRLGIKLEHRGDDAPTWDGKSVNLDGPVDYSDVAHEIAHWQVAAKHRRRWINFGLDDMDPYTGRAHGGAPFLIDGTKDEERASLLGIAYEAALGLDYQATLNHHGWWPYFQPKSLEEAHELLQEPANGAGFWKFWRLIFELQERGLLTGHLPTALLGDKKGGGST